MDLRWESPLVKRAPAHRRLKLVTEPQKQQSFYEKVRHHFGERPSSA